MITKTSLFINQKRVLFAIPILLFLLAFQYQTSSEIIGKWAFPDSPREIEIYIQNNTYFAKITQISGEEEDEKVGHILLKDFVYDKFDKKYSGEVDSPLGFKASGKLVLLDENRLKLSVSKFLVIKKSFTLTRIK